MIIMMIMIMMIMMIRIMQIMTIIILILIRIIIIIIHSIFIFVMIIINIGINTISRLLLFSPELILIIISGNLKIAFWNGSSLGQIWLRKRATKNNCIETLEEISLQCSTISISTCLLLLS